MSDLKELTADIVTSFVSNNSVAVGDLASLVQRTYEALEGLGRPKPEPDVEPAAKATPAQIRKSITPDSLACFGCGQNFKTLRRHLLSEHGWTPGEYVAQFGLPTDYPMVSEKTSSMRSEFAKSIGLGQKAAAAKKAAAKPARKRTPKAIDPDSDTFT
jgi:predicted transcriptional regulator